MSLCIRHLVEAQVNRAPHAVAFTAPGHRPLTYGRLRDRIDKVVGTLRSSGLGRNDRVATMLPNGPEMAVAFLAVAAGATCVPLNPACRAHEADFYLCDVNAKALVIQSDLYSPAREVARARGIRVIELLHVREAEAGTFEMAGHESSPQGWADFARPDDLALVLHTSGTMSHPKLVPLTHASICTSADNVRAALQLVEEDRCLNLMPLFHLHGLISAVLSSLAAGASVVCTPGFHPREFFKWLGEYRPTWYTAVPTMHQEILAHALANCEAIASCPLRFIRSASAPLPPRTMAELERIFAVPVIESYGMTEAAAQITSNPLPPGARKPGSAGMAAGPEVAIADECDRLLPPDEKGEIVIRGPNVMRAYENNPEANESCFTNHWLRTGDQGYLDQDGYLFITGRFKEIINRGGEKICPREVDEVLMDHPAVRLAVTFGVPHETLGEDVAAAVVLEDGPSATEGDIRAFVFERLAPYKVPAQVLIVDHIPRGSTGKLLRDGLAQKLTARPAGPFVKPRNPVEKTLVRIWTEILGVDQVGVYDNFFTLGGDSLLATRVLSRVWNTYHVKLPLVSLFEAPTIADFSATLLQGQGRSEARDRWGRQQNR
ncbi:MAG: AMP-binding protein [Thermodesulfobacteriota bacterium]|nr:AMP-binding protein [Thermodesulfobacteriota bacterium]